MISQDVMYMLMHGMAEWSSSMLLWRGALTNLKEEE